MDNLLNIAKTPIQPENITHIWNDQINKIAVLIIFRKNGSLLKKKKQNVASKQLIYYYHAVWKIINQH